jgi:polyphosphate glucokinase
MVLAVKQLAKGWAYDAVSIGIPSLVGHAGPKSEPGNLGGGWVGFDYAAAFGLPVKVMNDAAMQALGSYEGGRMLFIGLGTGVGAAMIAENAIVPLELGDLPWNRHRESLHDVLGREGLRRFGLAEWRRVVDTTLVKLMHAFIADYVVIGGGNAKRLRSLPHGIRRGHNLTAFRGGARLWGVDDVPILTTAPPVAPEARVALDWPVVPAASGRRHHPRAHGASRRPRTLATASRNGTVAGGHLATARRSRDREPGSGVGGKLDLARLPSELGEVDVHAVQQVAGRHEVRRDQHFDLAGPAYVDDAVERLRDGLLDGKGVPLDGASRRRGSGHRRTLGRK